MTREKPVPWGEAAPWFKAFSNINPRYDFSSLGGRFILLAFIANSRVPASQQFLKELAEADIPWDDSQLVAFAVSTDKGDLNAPLVNAAFPKKRVFHDGNMSIAAEYGLCGRDPETQRKTMRPGWFIIDPQLRVFAGGSITETKKMIERLRHLPAAADHAMPGTDLWAPVLMVPRVLSPEFCRELIRLYEKGEPEVSGFMVETDGRTLPKYDNNFKRRQDVTISSSEHQRTLNSCIYNRLVPEIQKAFQFQATRIERYIVACYDAEDQGLFRPHRDNTTTGTAHRKFAVTINLNSDEFEGGELRFPEFGKRAYKAPTGGAIVFSCSLLHEALPVTKGRRYATLPFLYDDVGAQLREKTRSSIGEAAKEGVV